MLTLTSGASSIVVAPEYGAGLTGWMLGRTPILRRALPQAAFGGDPHLQWGAFRCFRTATGSVGAGSTGAVRDYQLEPNFGDHPHTIHGVGWQRAWVVEEVGPRSVTLSLEHRPDPSWPFAFSAEIGYSLSDAALTVTIQMTNRHTGRGTGRHRPASPLSQGQRSHAALRRQRCLGKRP